MSIFHTIEKNADVMYVKDFFVVADGCFIVVAQFLNSDLFFHGFENADVHEIVCVEIVNDSLNDVNRGENKGI